jgi:transposase
MYPSDLTEEQFNEIAHFFEARNPGGKPRQYSRLSIVNGILYIAKTGAQWRFLPREYPPWKTVWHYFTLWTRDGTWGQAMDYLRGKVRIQQDRTLLPTAAIIDTRSVKNTHKRGMPSINQQAMTPPNAPTV